MKIRIVLFLALLFTALGLGPSLAHLLELPNKMPLNRENYLAVQQIYRGWDLLGVVVLGALFSNLVLTVLLWRRDRPFALALVAFLGIVAAQIVFWTYTFPANQATSNWTFLPTGWEALRRQWEYSHAVGAVCNLVAMLALIVLAISGSFRLERSGAESPKLTAAASARR